MAGTNLSKLSAAGIGRKIGSGDLDPIEVAGYFLDRVSSCPDQSVFLTVTADRALREAEASRRRRRNGSRLGILDGVPISFKDLIDVEDTVTTCGSLLFRDDPPAREDAPVVRRLCAAGMVCLGKTNLSEFAYSAIGMNPHFGTPLNPFCKGPPRIPGGSSSGAAVSVARGLAPAAIGTDTSGSVRIPASLCGLVGHHTSPGRIDRARVATLSMSLDTVGSLAHCVEDCILLDRVLRGEDAGAGIGEPVHIAKLSAIVPENYACDDLDPDIARHFETALEILAAAGLQVERGPIDELDAFARTRARHGTLVTAEAYYIFRDRLDDPRIGENTATRLRNGEKMSAYDLLAIQQTREALSISMAARLRPGKLLMMPTVPHGAPTIASLEENGERFAEVNLRTMKNTSLGNFFGLCGVTLPCGQDANGIPVGLLMCGPPGGDEGLLRAALAIERTLASVAA